MIGKVEYKKHDYSGTGTNDWKQSEYTNYKDWTDEATKDKNSYGNESVTKYGGFYIARYEAGWSGDPETKIVAGSSYVDTLEQAIQQRNVTTQKPVSKKGVFSWNFISQINAKKVSEDMYENVRYNGESKYSDSVQSKLVDGVAWDTVTTWISNSNVDVTNSIKYGNYFNTDIPYNGLYAKHIWAACVEPDKTSHWLCAKTFSNGNITLKTEEVSWDEIKSQNYADVSDSYSNNHKFWTRYEIPTGSVDNFKLKNIYDLAGNMYEWTTEVGNHDENGEAVTNGSSFAVLRGRYLPE